MSSARTDIRTTDVAVQEIVAHTSWEQWRCEVMAELRDHFREVLGTIATEEVDWDAWRPLYEEGRSARSAVDRAFLRDL